MANNATSSRRSYKSKSIAKQLVLIAQSACDLGDLELASQVLELAEVSALNSNFAFRDQRDLGMMLVGIHQRIWDMQHPVSTVLNVSTDHQFSTGNWRMSL